ncbi:Cupin-like domain-containing protein [Micromonospora matsumotoense]|uniref:Cupin-like domain-containing protein n=1 Tax=Micromonospora matsumotoense TaxID=121616 RepID=A0A1C5AJ43_9ACTN|nr:cupin-like domain-containing protein [Micromonospora matsumotoense]SCF45179.1 Cupin-like domain-containing protein [Micromonospora matsumotoense]
MTTLAPPRLDPAWREWLVENLAMGASVAEARDAAVAGSADPAAVDAELRELADHPYLAVCRRLALRYDWLESVLDTYRMLRNSDGGRTLERRADLTPDEFFSRYYFGNRPVVLDGLMADWPALGWTLDGLAAACGDAVVEVMTGRNANPDHAWQYDRHRTSMTFRDYLALLGSGTRTNDYYMVPRNENWSGALRPLAADIRTPEGIVDPSGLGHLLLGPAGTVTPLHVDNSSVLLGQVLGRKRVRLVPSYERHLVYPRGGTFSAVDAASPDLTRHPRYAEATVLDTVLEPGQLLFVPVGWWHWVEALEVSATVSFHHFRVPGQNHKMATPPAAGPDR